MSDGQRKRSGFYNSADDAWIDTTNSSDSFTQQADEGGQVRQISHADGPVFTEASSTDDEVKSEIRGRPPQNEDGVYAVCQRLALALKALTGINTTAAGGRPIGLENGSDWYLHHGGELVPVQVTRVGSQETWASLGRTSEAQFRLQNEKMASEIARSIESKRYKVDATTILALDAGITGGALFKPVVASWRSIHSASVIGLKVREIWLVGYSPETTFKLV